MQRKKLNTLSFLAYADHFLYNYEYAVEYVTVQFRS
jgi:hypothetical protein